MVARRDAVSAELAKRGANDRPEKYHVCRCLAGADFLVQPVAALHPEHGIPSTTHT